MVLRRQSQKAVKVVHLWVLVLTGVVELQGLPSDASGEKPACQSMRCKIHGFDSWVGKISWRRAQQPTPVFLPGESHGQRSLAGYSPRLTKSEAVIMIGKPLPAGADMFGHGCP